LVYAQADNDRVSVATLPMRDHAILLGRSVLAGRSMAELSFILARHVSYERPGFRMLTFYATLGELEGVIRAAITVSVPDSPFRPEPTPRAHRLAELLASKLNAPMREAIAQATRDLVEATAQLDLVAWARGVETMACRAGLLAAGDVTVATAALALSGVSSRDRALGLLPFVVSERYALLRRALGVAFS
jgi:hypothetical protein